MAEKVLVIPTEALRKAGLFQGFVVATPAYLDLVNDHSRFLLMDRDKAEHDPEFKQLIPYVVIRSGGMFFHYRRGKGGGEERLRSRRSIGVGGHINESDCDNMKLAYCCGLAREMKEEVDVGGTDVTTIRTFGFLNDDQTPVGRVHLGVVHVLNVGGTVKRRCEDLEHEGLSHLPDLYAQRDDFETWSQFLLDEFMFDQKSSA